MKLLLCLAAALTPMAATAMNGKASGTIDGRQFDIVIDCSQWTGSSDMATATAADGGGFEAVRLGYNESLAVTWPSDGKLYQLMFDDVDFAPVVTAQSAFSNRATGESYDATVTVDCSG